MILALAATLAIVVQDHTPLRAAPQANGSELTMLWQGDVLEIRGQRAGYLQVYNYRHERGGYLKSEAIRSVGIAEADAPELLAVLRFLRESLGSEALGISYGAAYLEAVPTRALTAEPLDAVARMAERLADEASGSTYRHADVGAHLEVVEQFGIHMRSFERHGRIQVCYDGELFRRVLRLAGASPEQRANAALGLTRPDCIDPNVGPVMRASLDDERGELLSRVEERGLSAMTKSRLHARRAGVWASIAFERARRREAAGVAAQRALSEVLDVQANDLGDDRHAEYVDAMVRVNAVRWAAVTAVAEPATSAMSARSEIPAAPAVSAAFARPTTVLPPAAAAVGGSAPPRLPESAMIRTLATQQGPLILSATSGDPGQTCISLEGAGRQSVTPLIRRCTYGIVWMASAQAIPEGPALVLAVQPLESWRELWVFRRIAGTWTVEVLTPGGDDAEEGYIEFAGFAPGTRRLLVVREVKERGRFVRRFEELRLDDLALVRQASTPELLRDFGRWQDVAWRRDTLALH